MLASPARVLAARCGSTSISSRSIREAYCLQVKSSRGRELYSMAASEPEFEPGTVVVSEEEWQRWGTSSPLPAMVAEIIGDLKSLERDFDEKMSFGGLGGKLQGNLKVQEDKKHRAVYQSLTDSEKKLQFFSARQVACRLLGSRGYLCQKCWLVMEDCMCSKLVSSSLWHGIRFWIYMHPKDFLRQNNTGKLLWQIFGTQAASLCLFGIDEQEEIMWDSFRQSGKNMVWFLYPNKNASPKSVQDIFDSSFAGPEGHTIDLIEKPLHFVLIDGTWSNSAAMYRRLKEKWTSIWGEEDLPCVLLLATSASVMHKLRPQPSWDRTCTAAAAAAVLSELSYHYPKLQLCGLDKQAEAVENGLSVLLEALTARRVKMGRCKERNRQFYCM